MDAAEESMPSVERLAKARIVEKVFVAPGNDGMADVAELVPIAEN